MSLRRSLVLAFSLLLTAIAAGSAFYAHHVTRHEAWELFDLQQQQVARFIGEDSRVPFNELVLPADDQDEDLVVQIMYNDGRPTRVSRVDVDFPAATQPGFSIFSDKNGKWRLFTQIDEARTIRVAQRTSEREEIADNAAWNSALPFLLAIPLSWLTVYVLVGIIMSRLRSIASEVQARGDHGTEAIDLARVPSEVKPLIAAMNKALANLSAALVQQKNFISDAAHELRTPLAALNLQVGNVVNANRDPALSGPISDLAAGIRRASRLTTHLLQLAREEAQTQSLPDIPADLEAAALEAVGNLLPLAEARRIDLGMVQAIPAKVPVATSTLVALIEILIDNAVRYTPEGGKVDVSIMIESERPVLMVQDSGPGISEQLQERVFDRFFRGGRSDGEGSGLGLSIARTIARRLGAEVSLRNRDGTPGLEARITFAPVS